MHGCATISGPRGRRQQAHKLLAHALGRQALASPSRSRTQAARPAASGAPAAILGREAEEAQDAQVVLADALARIADEAHAPRLRCPA